MIGDVCQELNEFSQDLIIEEECKFSLA